MNGEIMSEKFWAVWHRDGGLALSKRHETKTAAIEEANRLANQTHADYFVLEVVGIVAPVQVAVNYVELQ
jgi:uncharacterized membrane protein